MHALRPTILPVLLIFAWLVSGCSAPAPAQPQPGPSHPAGATPALGSQPPAGEDKPAETVDIRGRVIQTRRNAQGEPPVGTIQVEGTVEPGTRYDKATIHVGRETKIVLGRDGRPASFGFLHTGDLVEVTFAGPPTAATESYPVKATAATVIILEHVPY